MIDKYRTYRNEVFELQNLEVRSHFNSMIHRKILLQSIERFKIYFVCHGSLFYF